MQKTLLKIIILAISVYVISLLISINPISGQVVISPFSRGTPTPPDPPSVDDFYDDVTAYFSMDSTLTPVWKELVSGLTVRDSTSGNAVDAAGKLERCAHFPDFSTSAGFFVPDTDSLNFSGNFSVSVWVKFDSVGGSDRRHTIYNSYQFSSSLDPTLEYKFQFWNTSNSQKNNSITGFFVKDTWYNIVNVWDADIDSQKTYVNNVLKDSDYRTDTMRSSDGSGMAIGNERAFSGSNRGFHGSIDDMVFWRRALTLAEIDSIYNSGNGRYYYE